MYYLCIKYSNCVLSSWLPYAIIDHHPVLQLSQAILLSNAAPYLCNTHMQPVLDRKLFWSVPGSVCMLKDRMSGPYKENLSLLPTYCGFQSPHIPTYTLSHPASAAALRMAFFFFTQRPP